MYARIARFESDPSSVDDAIAMVRGEVESDTPPGLEGAKMLMLVDRERGTGLGITLFADEEAMRRGDEALNAMSPGGTERRGCRAFHEAPVPRGCGGGGGGAVVRPAGGGRRWRGATRRTSARPAGPRRPAGAPRRRTAR